MIILPSKWMAVNDIENTGQLWYAQQVVVVDPQNHGMTCIQSAMKPPDEYRYQVLPPFAFPVFQGSGLQ